MGDSSGPVTILGAGLAGLTAGYSLAKRGVSVQMFEHGSHVGGMAVTLEQDGYRFDLGPHRFHTEDKAILELVQALMGDELLFHQRSSRVRLNGRYLDYPPNVPSLMRSVAPATSLRCLYDYLRTACPQGVSQSEEADFESWVVNRFGQHLYDLYFGPYTRKVWGADPASLSAELARRRITVPNLADVLLRLMISSKRDPGPYVTGFWYPRDGIGRIAERLAEEIAARRGEIHLEHAVETVHLRAGRVVGLTVRHPGGRRFVPCERVLSTLPLPDLIYRLDPPVDEGIRVAAEGLPYRALVYVFVMLDRPQVTQEHWLYFPEAHILFNRLTEPRNFSPGHAPEGKTSLCAEITCDAGDAAWCMPPETLAQQTIENLAATGLLDPTRVEGFFTRRTRWGYPLYQVGYERHLGRLRAFVAEIETLATCGRQGGFDYSNMATAMASGLAAAREMLPEAVSGSLPSE
jgi:protoporphyrinogen oxidase